MRFLPLLAGAMLASLVWAGQALADCGSLRLDLQRALDARDFAAASQAVKTIGLSRECGPAERRAARAELATQLLGEARRLQQIPGNGDASDRLIEAAAALRASWEATIADGDLKLRRKAYAQAAIAYQEAINMLAAEQAEDGRARASDTQLAYIARRADEARHLAAAGPDGQLIETPSDRNGNTGGVYSAVLHRGAEAMRVPVPILFGFNSDQFTPIGQQAAEDFIKLLVERKPGTIMITGHTDRIGSQEFNQELSLRRARRVAEFLRSNGIAGDMRVVGKGKSEPRTLADPAAYDQTQIDELNRRVEFDWKP